MIDLDKKKYSQENKQAAAGKFPLNFPLTQG